LKNTNLPFHGGIAPEQLAPLLLDDDEHEEVSKEVDAHVEDLIESMPKQDQRLAQMVGEIDSKNQKAIAEFGVKSAQIIARYAVATERGAKIDTVIV
jgi:hypothetical protein